MASGDNREFVTRLSLEVAVTDNPKRGRDKHKRQKESKVKSPITVTLLSHGKRRSIILLLIKSIKCHKINRIFLLIACFLLFM